ncbi:flavoprotein oxygenase [Lipomyces oligophaga]|uniref:flavoprotein oxygenase n=1 Tax=Lipomyces oligophaga TaxID=45792 RepID=UPI0034CEC7D9
MSAAENTANREAKLKRNPHGDFNQVQKDRPAFETDSSWHYTRTVDIDWIPGTGANDDDWKNHEKVAVDPYQAGRDPFDNYKLLIAGIVPRPIGFVSTESKTGVRNLAPFSYTQVVHHDPPIFCIGFASSVSAAKDTLANILETGELTINIISEWFVEAANYTAVNAPAEVSEWALSGLTPLPSTKVTPPHVAESAFSIEAKLVTHHEWTGKLSGQPNGTLVIVEGINFHIRKDASNDQFTFLDPKVLKPVSRLGGISYGRSTQGFEMLRPVWANEETRPDVKKVLP